MQTLTDLAARLKPFMMRWIDEAGGGAGGAPSPHDLDSAHHSGSLADSQATQFLKTDGTRTLTGNMAVSALATIDGVDISAHDADSNAHHNQAHDLSGADHLGTGLTVGFVIRATGASSFAWAELQHGDLGGLGEDDHHVAFEELGSDSGTAIPEETNDRITIAGGTNITSAGATNTITINFDPSGPITWTGSHLWDDGVGDSPTIGFRGGSNDDTAYLGLEDHATSGYSDFIISLVGDTVQAGLIVRNAAGTLDVFSAWADGSFDHTGPVTITKNSGTQLTLAYDGSYYAGLAVSSVGDLVLDAISDDILPVANYEINLGKLTQKYLTIHAAELWVETLVAQDTIATIGGRILVGPTTIFEADLASGTTHGTQLVLNPGFETAGGGGVDVFGSWSENAGTGTITRDTDPILEGTYSCELVAGASVDTYVDQTITVSASTDYEWIFYTRGDGTYGGRFSVYDVSNSAYITSLTATGITGTTFMGVYHAFTTPSGCVSIRIRLQCPSTSAGVAHFDSNLLGTPVEITVKHNAMTAGDVAYSEADGKVEFFVITSSASGSGPYTYQVRRDLDGSGANDWYEGDALFSTGAAGDGFIDLYSYSGIKSGTVGPTIVGNVRITSLYNDWSEGWAIGHLEGLYGQSSGTYGAGLGIFDDGSYVLATDTGGLGIWAAGSKILSFPISGDAQIVGNLTVTNPGVFSAASGNVVIDDGGITIEQGTGTSNKIKWHNSGTEIGYLAASATGGNYMHIEAEEPTGGGIARAILAVDPLVASSAVNTSIRCYLDTVPTSYVAFMRIGTPILKLDNIAQVVTCTDPFYASGDMRIGSGLYVGSIATDPDDNDIHFDGNLKSMKNSTYYDVYGFVPLTTSLTSTSWDGDSYSTTAKTLIDLSAVFGAPAGIKTVLFRILVRDSGASGTDCWINLGPTNVSATGVGLRCMPADDRWSEGTVVVSCDSNGDVYYQLGASGASTLEIYLQIWGYWI